MAEHRAGIWRRDTPLSGMTSPFREATRRLARTPLFTVVSTLSIAVGVGVATSVFAVVHEVFFAPAPYQDAERLVEIWQTERPDSRVRSDYLQPERMRAWVDEPMRYFSGVAGFGLSSDQTLEGGSGPARVGLQPTVGDWFGTLGTPAMLGRVLTADDALPRAEPAAVVSWAVWRQRLGGSSDAVGRVVRLGGTAYTVVGVMPRAFTAREVVWVPDASLPDGRRPVAYLGVARLRPGATLEQGRDEIETRAAAQVAEDSLAWGGFGATTIPMTETIAGGDRPALWILAGVVGAVLLIGLSNLTTLFLVRARERSPALAVRAALGARTWHLGGGLVAEALLVAVGGSALGFVLALWGRGVAAALVLGPSTAPPQLGIASVVLAVTLATAVTAIVGLEPLRGLRSLDVQRVLQRRGGGAGRTAGERRSRNRMVSAQVAACVVLVSMLGVFAVAYRTYVAVDPGYDARRVVRAAADWQTADMDEPAQWALAREVASRVRRDPAVSGAALWDMMLGAWPPQPQYAPEIEGAPDDAPGVGYRYRVDPGFFGTIGISIVRGRDFTEADDAGSPPVVIVTKDGADAWWPGQNPLGNRIRFGRGAPWMTVVGVVSPTGIVGRDGRGSTVRATRRREWAVTSAFVPARQWTTLPPAWRADSDCEQCRGVSLAVRATGDVPEAERALLAGLRTLAPALPLNFVMTINEQQMSSSYYARQIIPPGRIAAVGSLVGLLLALLGIVGVVADGVASRTREIGVRMALGAPAHRVLGAVARESVMTGVVGLAAGLAVLIALRDVLANRVVDMQIRRLALAPSLTDPTLLVTAAAVVLALMLAAALATARRALRVDPATALRSE